MLIVFFLCGLWHGANLTFVIWGLWHGLFLVLEKVVTPRISFRLPLWGARVYTLFVVVIGWVFFRAESLNDSITYLQEMFTFSLHPLLLSYYPLSCFVLLLSIVLTLSSDRFFSFPTSKTPKAFSSSLYFIQIFLALISIISLLASMRLPFIYFTF